MLNLLHWKSNIQYRPDSKEQVGTLLQKFGSFEKEKMNFQVHLFLNIVWLNKKILYILLFCVVGKFLLVFLCILFFEHWLVRYACKVEIITAFTSSFPSYEILNDVVEQVQTFSHEPWNVPCLYLHEINYFLYPP